VVSWNGSLFALWIGAAAGLVLLAHQLGQRDLNLTALSCFAIFLALVAQRLGLLTPDLVVRAGIGGVSFAGFLLSLQFLFPAVERSDLVERVGQIFVRQPPGRRYYALSVGVNFLGLLLSLSAIPLFLTMVRRTLDENPTPIPERANHITRRRSASAIQRGLSMVPLWSPVSLVIVVLSSTIPDIVWIEYFPYGVALSVGLVLVGRWLDRLQNPGVAGLSEFSTRLTPGPLLALLCIMAMVPAIAWIASAALQGPRLLGLLLAFPIVGTLFHALQSIRLGRSPVAHRAVSNFASTLHQRFRQNQREVAVFLLIGILSALVIPIVRHLHLVDYLSALPAPPELILFACMILALGLSFVGISPLISSTLIVDMFIGNSELEIHRTLLILSAAFLVGQSWLVSPVSFGTMNLSRELGIPVREILTRWNLPYVACTVTIFGALLAVVGMLF
jgi:hypothetical protein